MMATRSLACEITSGLACFLSARPASTPTRPRRRNLDIDEPHRQCDFPDRVLGYVGGYFRRFLRPGQPDRSIRLDPLQRSAKRGSQARSFGGENVNDIGFAVDFPHHSNSLGQRRHELQVILWGVREVYPAADTYPQLLRERGARVTGHLPTRRLAALARRRSPARHGLGCKGHRILQAMTHPTLQILILLKTRGSDIHKALHRSSGEVHWASVRLPDQIFISLRPDPNHQVVLDDPDGHVPSNHEGNAAEHLPLGDVAAVAKNSADTLCQSFDVGHVNANLMLETSEQFVPEPWQPLLRDSSVERSFQAKSRGSWKPPLHRRQPRGTQLR